MVSQLGVREEKTRFSDNGKKQRFLDCELDIIE